MFSKPLPPPGFSLVDTDHSPPPPPPGFTALPNDHPIAQAVLGTPTGQAHDGDTFRLSGGNNARLWGADAFELNQKGRAPDGSLVPLGKLARGALLPYLKPGATLTANGLASYNRPVASLSLGGDDAGKSLLDQGLAVSTPEYLRSNPQMFQQYTQAERLARLNRRGAFNDTFTTPKDYRRGAPDPWAAPQQGQPGDSQAVFWDDPTPFQGLKPDVAAGLQSLYNDKSSTADQIMAYAKNNGFELNPSQVQTFIKERARPGSQIAQGIGYQEKPRVLTNLGDGGVGAFMRGVADPINMLDEGAAIGDSLIPGKLWAKGQSRENVWDSPRRFGDILANNLGQERSILDYDQTAHPWARTGGQLAGGLIYPGASVEGLGAAAFRDAIASGAGEYAAKNIARRAVVNRLGTAGAVEGTLAGAGQGEDWKGRLTGALLGAPSGYALGVGAGYLAPHIASAVGRPFSRLVGNEGEHAAEGFSDGAVDAGKALASNDLPQANDSIPTPPEGFTIVSPAQAMANETPQPSIYADAFTPRTVDRIDVNAGRVRPLLDPATEMDRRAAAQRINPSDLLPLPANTVASVDEAAGIGAGRLSPVRPPDEMAALDRRNIPSPVDATRTLPKRGPLDLVTWLRTQGGIRPQGGELAHYGIDNAPRQGMDFAGGEGRFGKLVDPVGGMPYDEAAMRAHEAGYFPDHAERPTVSEFLDTLQATHSGRNRAFLPGDLPEVDAFNAARSQRHAVEAASDAGAPMVQDRGQSVGLADLEANAPPLEAYQEWGENAPNLAGNVRLDKLDSPQAIKRALTQVDNVSGGFDAARRGRITQAETESLASELNMTPADLLKRRKGEAFNAEQALAARQILAKSGNELVNMAKRLSGSVASGEASPADLAKFREAIVRHAAIQEQVSGATAEAGRALQQFRMTADSRNVRGDVLKSLLEQSGGEDGAKAAADLILENASDPKRLNNVVNNLAAPKLKDKAVELWYNWLLSGPRTHAVNMTSNLLTALAQIPEHGIAAGIGMARKALPGQADTDRVLFSELGARTAGMLQGAREGFAEFGRTMRTGTTRDYMTKVEAQETQAIPGKLGSVIRTPTRLLSAEDEFFKAIARRSEIVGQAVRKANSEGLRGKAARVRAGELAANPTPEMSAAALDYGRYVTFQQPLGESGRKLVSFTNSHPLIKLFVPFVRTPVNLLKFAAERSPAAPLLKEWRADLMAGGAKRDLALARATAGSGAMMMAIEAARQGMLTGGGPADDSAKRLMYANGWQPYSVKIGDRYYSYQRLDPFSTTLGLASDWVDLQSHMTDKEREQTANLLVGSTLQNLASKTWLSGVTNLADALNDPGRYGQNFAASLASSMAVPAIVSQSAQALDPFQRDAQGIMDRVRSRVPGLSRSLPVRRDVLGQPINSANSGGLDAFSPMYTSTARHDPVATALLQSDVHLSSPSRNVNKQRLSPALYDAYQVAIAKNARPKLNALVTGPGWPRMRQDDKQDAVDKVMMGARRASRGALFPALATEQGASSVPPPPPGFQMVPPPPPGFNVVGK